MRKILYNNKGFTLTELIVTAAIMVLVAGLLASITPIIYRQYNTFEYRWLLQTEALTVMKEIESAQNGIKSAASANVFYEENVGGAGTIIQGFDINKAKTSTLFTAKVDDDQLLYTYFFTIKSDENNGYFFWKGMPTEPAADGSNYVFTRISTIPMKIDFEIPIKPVEKVIEDDKWVDGIQDYLYLKSSISVTIMGAGQYKTDYKLSKTVSMDNMFQNQRVNYTEGVPTNNKIAGWTDIDANEYSLNVADELPVDFTQYPNASNIGNIVRYIPIEMYYADIEGLQEEDLLRADTLGICATERAYINCATNDAVLSSLRNFRDTKLKNNVLGENIIDFYYDVWSPAWISVMDKYPDADVLYRNIITPVAEVVG